MSIDFVGCYLIEIACKHLFADLKPKKMVTKGLERRLARRAAEKEQAVVADSDKKIQ